MDSNGIPETPDEWIRKLAETISTAEIMWMRSDVAARYSDEDCADTIDENERLIRWHLAKAGLLPHS